MLHYRVDRSAETIEILPRVESAAHSGRRGRAELVGEAVSPRRYEAGPNNRCKAWEADEAVFQMKTAKVGFLMKTGTSQWLRPVVPSPTVFV